MNLLTRQRNRYSTSSATEQINPPFSEKILLYGLKCDRHSSQDEWTYERAGWTNSIVMHLNYEPIMATTPEFVPTHCATQRGRDLDRSAADYDRNLRENVRISTFSCQVYQTFQVQVKRKTWNVMVFRR